MATGPSALVKINRILRIRKVPRAKRETQTERERRDVVIVLKLPA